MIHRVQIVALAVLCLASENASAGADESCLGFPSKGIRPAIDATRASELAVTPDGKVAVFSDAFQRMIAWSDPSRDPVLYPGVIAIVGATPYGAAYGLSPTHQLVRVDLSTGLTSTRSGISMPVGVTAVGHDETGRFIAVAEPRGTGPSRVRVIDDCIVPSGDKRCGAAGWSRPISVTTHIVSIALSSGADKVVTFEVDASDNEDVVVRNARTGIRLASWRAERDSAIVVGEHVVEWGLRSGTLPIRKLNGMRAGEVAIGRDYAGSESECYSVQAGVGELAIIRRVPDCPLPSPEWSWAIIDVTKRKIVWQSRSPLGAVATSSGGMVWTATAEAICFEHIQK